MRGFQTYAYYGTYTKKRQPHVNICPCRCAKLHFMTRRSMFHHRNQCHWLELIINTNKYRFSCSIRGVLGCLGGLRNGVFESFEMTPERDPGLHVGLLSLHCLEELVGPVSPVVSRSSCRHCWCVVGAGGGVSRGTIAVTDCYSCLGH